MELLTSSAQKPVTDQMEQARGASSRGPPGGDRMAVDILADSLDAGPGKPDVGALADPCLSDEGYDFVKGDRVCHHLHEISGTVLSVYVAGPREGMVKVHWNTGLQAGAVTNITYNGVKRVVPVDVVVYTLIVDSRSDDVLELRCVGLGGEDAAELHLNSNCSWDKMLLQIEEQTGVSKEQLSLVTEQGGMLVNLDGSAHVVAILDGVL